MGKLADLSSVKSSKVESFVYTPPMCAFDAVRILVTYSAASARIIDTDVLRTVLRGLRRANPFARIMVIEGQRTERIDNLLDGNMRVCVPEDLRTREFKNSWQESDGLSVLHAPEYIAEYDCRISLCGFQSAQDHISASVVNLIDLVESPEASLISPTDLYFTLGLFFDGAVVDLTHKMVDGESIPVGQVVWGDDLLAVDAAAARLAGEPTPDYFKVIRDLRKSLRDA